MVDIDGDVVEACREHLPEMHQGAFDDPRLEVRIEDAIKILEEGEAQWDFIISDLSDPIEEGPSFQLFTKEYYEKARRALAPGGMFVVQAGSVSPIELRLHARIVKTLREVFPHVHSYSAHTASYGAPWGFALAATSPIETRPDPKTIDSQLAAKTIGGFKLIDGIGLLGLLQTPLHLRRAIEQETQIYTLASPPVFFGAKAESAK